jgi:hypothetical protein
MAINTARIDEQIRRLQDLKRMASDPETLRLWENLMAENNGPIRPARTFAHPLPMVKENPSNSGKKGDVLRAARKAVATLNGRFKAPSVLEAMQREGFALTVEKPLVVVNGALRRLIKKGEIKIVMRGSGRNGHQYEQTGKALGG